MESIRKVASLSAALSAGLALSGCSYLIHTVGDPLAEAQVKRLKLPTSRGPGFSQCLDQAGGLCTAKDNLADLFATRGAVPSRRLDTRTAAPRIPLLDENGKRLQTPATDTADSGGRSVTSAEFQRLQVGALAAERARRVLEHPAQMALNDLFNSARESRTTDPFSDAPAPSSKPIVIDIGQFNDYMEKIEEATELDGWEALERQLAYADATEEDQVRRKYINAYFKAYFRNGKFYSVTMDGKELQKKVAARLADALPGVPGDAPYDDLAKRLFSELKFDDSKQRVLGKIATEGFVTRGGQDIKMPAIEAELDLASGKSKVTKVDTTAVASDLVRVLLHAVYDAHDRIPGVTNATGYSKDLKTQLGTNDPKKTKVDAADFGEIEARAARVELLVSTGVGRLVRGLGIVALNNEAIAAAIETAVGVAARKHTEKVLWCWTACELNSSKTTSDAAMTLPDETSIEIRIAGEPSRTFGVARPK